MTSASESSATWPPSSGAASPSPPSSSSEFKVIFVLLLLFLFIKNYGNPDIASFLRTRILFRCFHQALIQHHTRRYGPGLRSLSSLHTQPVHWTKDPRAGTSASPIPLTPNQHWTVHPESGERVVDFDFVEEPLGMRESMGYGFAQFEFGESLVSGGSRSYSPSQAWVGDEFEYVARPDGTVFTIPFLHAFVLYSNQPYFALKALNGHCTQYATKGSSLPTTRRPLLPPRKGSAGSHLCLVTPLFGGDITRYARSSNLLRYPLPLAKHILLHTLRALNDLHEGSIVHTDIKSDNIFFDTTLENEDIRGILEWDPSRRHQAEASYDGIVHAAVSQPLPLPTIEEFAKRTFVLGDLGSAQPIGQRITDYICPESLRPPEIYIGGPWDEKVDIWSFGCLVYEIVTGVPLFNAKEGSVDGVHLDATEIMLFQMIAHTREVFMAEQLSASPLAGHYFNETCQLKKQPERYLYQTEHWVARNSDGDVGMDEAKEVVRFMLRCLRLDPEDRASARELLRDKWFDDARHDEDSST
ncbi:kinase-like domain-containing protein [Desarmillaria tabescens]|uniref:Kinase-like domain-containing protein n=1 Tax=Armillaria tabescens TaxID=1929756 RepID=A0AA39NR12_ARMTA|nr:kinase-like domain-containing protein [Desarmillaria tabescens]KAK0470238.1 kinase-like domain-containing protein [Desarmillaria tabescens]